ncbi:MAG: Uma2 family endonuclease [Chloroflexi bacterium]|nr:Uma2 family endonuclease [Chloroflexota bacterium]
MALHLPRRRFTVEEYHRMAEAGILGEDDRVELIEGEITEMTPIGRLHAATVNRLIKLFVTIFGDDAVVGAQNPIVLDEHSEPQPDIALLRPKADFYASGHPTPEDVFFLVAVACSSADPDRRIKVPLYARKGIAECWLVDLEQETITVYRDPAADGYRTARVFRRGEQIAPAAFPDRSLAVAAILG